MGLFRWWCYGCDCDCLLCRYLLGLLDLWRCCVGFWVIYYGLRLCFCILFGVCGLLCIVVLGTWFAVVLVSDGGIW